MRLIDGDDLMYEFPSGDAVTTDYVREIIRTKPEIIVRCKDCKWWNKQGVASKQGRCEIFKIFPMGSWFCANGKR